MWSSKFKHSLFYFEQKAHRTFKLIFEGAHPGVLCWKKPEYVEETTEFGQATTAVPHANARNRSLAAAVTREGFITALPRP